MAVRRRLIAHGRVHGVGFRVSVARVAQLRGVAGWARNRSDGTVEIVLEGGEEPVESVVRFCREGPRAATVTHMETATEQPEGLIGFKIR
jgi:acylphosphatase